MGVRVEKVKKSFPEFNINIDFNIGKGELVTLLGPSGCGKSTTLSLISGILNPDSGDIIIGSSRVTDVPIWQRDIGIVFQDYALFPHMDVVSNITYGLRARKMKKEIIREIYLNMLDLVHLKGYENRKIESLSGGEKQRIALARALAPSPRLLLLDEPLSALDAGLRRILRREIHEIQKKLGITTIYVTHDQEEALSISDRIILMNGGTIEQTGTPWELYNHPSTKFSADFLGDSNKIPCRIENISETNGISLKSDINKSGFILPYRKGIKKNSDYILFFRPQDTHIISNRDNNYTANRITGEVLLTEYSGRYLTVEYQCKNIHLKTEVPGGNIRYRNSLTAGDRIEVSVNPEKCWLIETRI